MNHRTLFTLAACAAFAAVSAHANNAAAGSALVNEAFQNLATGLTHHERTFAAAIPGFRFIADPASGWPISGVLVAPRGKFTFSRKVTGNKGLYIYYSTNSAGVTTMTSKSKGGTNEIPNWKPAGAELAASGAGGSTEETGDTLSVSVVNTTAAPVFVVFIALQEAPNANAAAKLPVIPALRALAPRLVQTLKSQPTAKLQPTGATFIYAKPLNPSQDFEVKTLDVSGAGRIFLGTSTSAALPLAVTVLTAEDEPMVRTPDAKPDPAVPADNGPKNAKVRLANRGQNLALCALVHLAR